MEKETFSNKRVELIELLRKAHSIVNELNDVSFQRERNAKWALRKIAGKETDDELYIAIEETAAWVANRNLTHCVERLIADAWSQAERISGM